MVDSSRTDRDLLGSVELFATAYHLEVENEGVIVCSGRRIEGRLEESV